MVKQGLTTTSTIRFYSHLKANPVYFSSLVPSKAWLFLMPNLVKMSSRFSLRCFSWGKAIFLENFSQKKCFKW